MRWESRKEIGKIGLAGGKMGRQLGHVDGGGGALKCTMVARRIGCIDLDWNEMCQGVDIVI